MGGAFVGLADDWSAPFWNPAGLPFIKGWGVGHGVDFISLRAMDGNSIANPLPPYTHTNVEQGDPFLQFGGEPTRFNVNDTTIRAALPSLVGYKTWDRWSFSAGIYSPLGFAFAWEDKTIPGLRASFDSQGYIVEYNLSLARQWADRWSIGVGFNWLDARLSRSAVKETSSYASRSTSDGRGQAVQGVLGLLGRLHDKVSAGFTYKTPSVIDMEGTASVLDTRMPMAGLNNEVSAVTSELLNPPTYTVGFAFYPVSALTLTTDWEGTDWRAVKTKVIFAQPGIALQNQDFNAGWRFTHRARFGGEYRIGENFEKQTMFRWGYTWDPYAVPESGVSMSNFVDVSRHVYTLGWGLRWAHWEPQLGFAYATGSRSIQNVEYKKVDRLLSVALVYRGL